MKPIREQVLIKPSDEESVTAGGIIIPDTAKEKPVKGTVIAAGPGTKDEPMVVKPGDVVMFNKYAGTEITVDNEDYIVMREDQIMLILN